MSDNNTFDPRYRPEFQRGYDGAVHWQSRTTDPDAEIVEIRPASPPPTAPAPTIPPVSRRDRRMNGQTDAGSDDAHESETRDGWMDDVVRAEDDLDDSELEAQRPVSAAPWRNPWVIALAVIGFVLTIGGVAAYRSAVEFVYSGWGMYGSAPSPDDERPDYIAFQLNWSLGPFAAILGMVSLLVSVAYCAFYALRTPRSHPLAFETSSSEQRTQEER